MSRGNPYGTDSFPGHERTTRILQAATNGSAVAAAFGWPGHEEGMAADFGEVLRRESGLTRLAPLPWAAQLVSEQTRQFYAYKNITDRWIPHVVGAFRAAAEEHLPLTLVNDWDLTADGLARYAVLMLPNAAALSDAQADAVREYVKKGGGLVATGETSLCDDLGRPRGDFALADLFGVSYQGRPKAPVKRPELDPNFALAIDENYWKQRTGVATLTWADHPLTKDDRLEKLVPRKSVTFRGPLAVVSEPKQADEVGLRMRPEGWDKPPLPAAALRKFGEGRVAYFAAAVDAALWSYAYPYQRILLARALEWAAKSPAPVTAAAPLCVQATYWTQADRDGRRVVVHLFNGVNTAANHGLPATDVPLREEVLPIHGIEVRFRADAPKGFRVEPGGRPAEAKKDGGDVVVTLPPLEIHSILVGEY
jgi:hypothetical protein